jgi:hypothetical protein
MNSGLVVTQISLMTSESIVDCIRRQFYALAMEFGCVDEYWVDSNSIFIDDL